MDYFVYAAGRADLAELNIKCQQARDNEIRYGLQRSRLEAERATLLARIVEAVAPPAVSAVPYAVTWQTLAVAPPEPVLPVSTARPTLSTMIGEALQNVPDGLPPSQVIKALCARGCQSSPAVVYRAGESGTPRAQRRPLPCLRKTRCAHCR
jgi:hypothetical protein